MVGGGRWYGSYGCRLEGGVVGAIGGGVVGAIGGRCGVGGRGDGRSDRGLGLENLP